MSPRRRLLVAVVVALLLVGVGVVGVRLLSAPAPAADPVARPAQDRPGPVLLVPGYGGSRGGLQQLAARIEATGRSATVLTLVGDGTGDLSAQVAVLDAAVD
ncbi:MAG TPA: lipase, partial [Pseudonocardia sp.]|nr:lipase [Pseudonocardia sp.]